MTLRHHVALLACGLVAVSANVASQPAVPAPRAASTVSSTAGPLLGFTAGRSTAQREREARFDQALSADNLRAWMKRLSARPHHVGSPYGRENAEFVAGLFRSWGYDTRLDEYEVLLPTPVTRVVELVAPTRYVASLSEPGLAQDATSAITTDQLPTYNAYSIDGDVTADLVYVNYGVPGDYDELARRGIDVKGRIVIARYGGSWRGIKPKVAAERGAIGCLIYSDPRDDGYAQGDVYPVGGWRSDRSAQRGSVADMPLYPGDPLTPGVGATKEAQRPANFKDAATLTKIPVLPISYSDALPLLKALGGPMAPESWRGALPIPYRLGPGPARVHLKLVFDWKLVPAFNVIAMMKGSELPDQWIIRGNHHDAWVFGATDPTSGMVAVLEEARAISELSKAGWRPRRTIVFAGWDGEEPGLLGSTEWVEHHGETLDRNAAVYINSDSNSRGFFGAGGSHTLERFVNEVSRDVIDPKKGISAADRLLALMVLRGSPDERALARDARLYELEPLGSGSDFTPFLQHAGIASLNVGFGGEDEYGQYHSIYDSFDHYVRFMDSDFSYTVALARVGGRLVMRLADADVLPFEFTRFSAAVSKYAAEVEKLADSLRADAVERNRRLDDKAFEAVATPGETWVAPSRLDTVPFINFAPLKNAVARVEASAREFDRAVAMATANGGLSTDVRARLDEILMKTERALTRKEGLPGRPWFRHQVYAPGFYTGYGVKTLPAVREALEQRQWPEAEQQVIVLAKTLEGYAGEIDRATALLR